MSRLLFCQLWCRLNVLSGDDNTLLPVCKLFEVLLLQLQPRLFMHLVNIGLQPLKVGLRAGRILTQLCNALLFLLIFNDLCLVSRNSFFSDNRWRFPGFSWVSWEF